MLQTHCWARTPTLAKRPWQFHLFTSCFFAPLFAHFSAKRCNERDGRKPLRLRIYPFGCKTSRKRCRKLSKNIKKNRKKGAVRTTHESTADPRWKTLHLFAFFSQKAACTAAHCDFQFFSFRYKTCSKQWAKSRWFMSMPYRTASIFPLSSLNLGYCSTCRRKLR